MVPEARRGAPAPAPQRMAASAAASRTRGWSASPRWLSEQSSSTGRPSSTTRGPCGPLTMRMGATVRARPDGLVSPPVAPALDVLAASVAEAGRADDDDLEALRPGLVAPPRTGRDAHRVPLLALDALVAELHPPAPAHDDVHLLLLLVRVAVRKAIAGGDALVAQAGSLELERIGRQAELQVRRAVEPRADVLQILLQVPERERHGAILWQLIEVR